jgi:hypothetical protein
MTQDEVIEMAKQAWVDAGDAWVAKEWFDDRVKAFEAFARLVAAKEREECAKVCDGLADMHEKMNQWGSHKTADTLAQAIRARGEQA